VARFVTEETDVTCVIRVCDRGGVPSAQCCGDWGPKPGQDQKGQKGLGKVCKTQSS